MSINYHTTKLIVRFINKFQKTLKFLLAFSFCSYRPPVKHKNHDLHQKKMRFSRISGRGTLPPKPSLSSGPRKTVSELRSNRALADSPKARENLASQPLHTSHTYWGNETHTHYDNMPAIFCTPMSRIRVCVCVLL